jgi:hypothetical protein
MSLFYKINIDKNNANPFDSVTKPLGLFFQVGKMVNITFEMSQLGLAFEARYSLYFGQKMLKHIGIGHFSILIVEFHRVERQMHKQYLLTLTLTFTNTSTITTLNPRKTHAPATMSS